MQSLNLIRAIFVMFVLLSQFGYSQPASVVLQFQGENLMGISRAYRGQLASQSMKEYGSGWQNDSQLFWDCDRVGCKLEINITVQERGFYDLVAYFTKAPDYGIFSIFLNGIFLKKINGYNKGTAIPTGEMKLGRVRLKKGVNRFNLTVNGKDSKSSGYFVGIDAFEFYPIDTEFTKKQEEPAEGEEEVEPPIIVSSRPIDLGEFVGKFQAEDLISSAKAYRGPVRIEKMDDYEGEWGNDTQLLWDCDRVGCKLDLNFSAPAREYYDVKGFFTKGPNYGRVRVFVNGIQLTNFNGYNKGGVVPSGEVSLGRIRTRKGANKVEFTVYAKDSKSTGFKVGIDAIEFVKME